MNSAHLVTCVQFKVNGREFYTMNHRIPLERVRAMRIEGDVSITTINVIGVKKNMASPRPRLFPWTSSSYFVAF